ncbi:hypothetical protein DY000_02001228 [Brassica cretica]|uniref:Uncharacterized protein n=1 Tax=Brassica cretica TaxID=69181 RepID=A0ABQ7BXX7_BRACR|nr:hypothetical protein DY000_02001228 [Brassica cretica]
MEMKDTTALHMIQNALAFENFPWIASATSSKEAWDLLLVKSLGGPLFQARKLLDLKKEYHNMKMSDTETVHQFTDKLMELSKKRKTLSISDLINFLLVHEYYTKPAQESVEESVTGVEKCLGDKRETSNSSENVSQSKRSIRKVKVSQVASTERPRREEERELKVFLVLISFLVLIYLLF